MEPIVYAQMQMHFSRDPALAGCAGAAAATTIIFSSAFEIHAAPIAAVVARCLHDSTKRLLGALEMVERASLEATKVTADRPQGPKQGGLLAWQGKEKLSHTKSRQVTKSSSQKRKDKTVGNLQSVPFGPREMRPNPGASQSLQSISPNG